MSLVQSWTRAGLFGSGSGRDFQIISGFLGLILSMLTQYNFSFFFKYFYCIFHLNLYSVASTRLNYYYYFFFFCNNGLEQHRIICRPVFARYIISSRNRTFVSFVGFRAEFVQWVSGSGRENPPASHSAVGYNRNGHQSIAIPRSIFACLAVDRVPIWDLAFTWRVWATRFPVRVTRPDSENFFFAL